MNYVLGSFQIKILSNAYTDITNTRINWQFLLKKQVTLSHKYYLRNVL